jgi:hypothetical protein
MPSPTKPPITTPALPTKSTGTTTNTSVLLLDCQPPLEIPRKPPPSPIGSNVPAPHLDLQADPPPPAEPPPLPPSPAHNDTPPGSFLDNIFKCYKRPGLPSTLFKFPLYAPSTLHAASSDTILNHNDAVPPSASIIRVVMNPQVFWH